MSNREICISIWSNKTKFDNKNYEQKNKSICNDVINEAMRKGSCDNLSCIFISFQHFFQNEIRNKTNIIPFIERLKKVDCDKLIETELINNDKLNSEDYWVFNDKQIKSLNYKISTKMNNKH